MDIRPAVDAIMAMIARCGVVRPLVVVMGEDYSVPAHTALRQGLMTRLLQTATPFAYGMARPHDLLGYIIESQFGEKVPRSQRERLSALDHDGQKLARSFRAALHPAHTPFAAKNLMALCHENGVNIRANDAVKTRIGGDLVLDDADPATHTLAVTHRPHIQGLISASNTDGVALRNLMIAERAMAHMQESGMNLYIQDCGMGQMLGYQSANAVWPHSESLSAIFARAGADVLPVYVADFVYAPGSLPAGGDTMLAQQGLVVEDMNTQRFQFGMTAPYMEQKFVENVSAHSGNVLDIFPEMTPKECALEKGRISREIPRWLQQAGIKP